MNSKQIVYCSLLLVTYNATSIVLALIFKLMASKYNFKFPLTILMMQQIGICIISTLGLWLKDRIQGINNISIIDRLKEGYQNIRIIYLISIFYILHQQMSLIGINYISIPIYLAFKRCSIIFVVIMKIIMCKTNQITLSMVLCSLIITISTCTAVVDDIMNGSMIGYVALILNNVFSITYAELTSRVQNQYINDSLSLVQQNTVVTIPIILLIGTFSGIFQDSYIFIQQNYDQTQVIELFVLIVIVVIVIFIHSLLFMICTKQIDIFNIKLSANLKDIMATLLSIAMFDDINLSFQVKMSLVISFIGAILYCLSKWWEDQDQSEQELIEDDITIQYYKSGQNDLSYDYLMSPNKMSINQQMIFKSQLETKEMALHRSIKNQL